MRALALLLLIAAPGAMAAPVPKEVRKPSLSGTWEITAAYMSGIEQKDRRGQHWKLGADGNLSNPYYSTGTYVVGAEGVDFLFGADTIPNKAFIELGADHLKVAFAHDKAKRAADCIPANNHAVYTFKRVEE